MATEPRGCIGFIFRLFGFGPASTNAGASLPKVQINKSFVSNAEADFFRVLRNVVGERGHILSQVSLRQLVWFPGNNQSNPGRQAWQNRVAAKSVDFVICDAATLKPKLAIELDEPSHAQPKRQTRDEQVGSILEAAGLPLIRVLTSRTYDTRELDAAISPHLHPTR